MLGVIFFWSIVQLPLVVVPQIWYSTDGALEELVAAGGLAASGLTSTAGSLPTESGPPRTVASSLPSGCDVEVLDVVRDLAHLGLGEVSSGTQLDHGFGLTIVRVARWTPIAPPQTSRTARPT